MKTQLNPDHVIHVLATGNPKRPNTQSAAYWPLYKQGMTVAQFAAAHKKANAAFSPKAVIDWDAKRKFIAVLPPGQTPKDTAAKTTQPSLPIVPAVK